jgi:site-specific DNA-cytosine methylase
MKKEFLQVITQQVSDCYPEIIFGIEPIFINSSLLSAQSRQRYYWTNIPGIKQPEDRGIVLKDILEDNFESDRDKSYCIDANYSKTGAKPHHYKDKYRRQLVNKPIKVGMNVEEVKIRKHKVDEKALQKLLRSAKKDSKKTIKDIAKECNVPLTKAEHWFRTDSSFAIPKDTVWIKLKFVLGITTKDFDKALLEFEYRDGVYESTQRVYSDQGKSPTLTASNKEQMIETKPKQVGVAVDIKGHDQIKRVYSPEGKSPTVTTCGGGHREPKVVTGGAFRGRAYDKDGKRMDKNGVSVANKTKQMLELRNDNKSNAITTVGKDSIAVNEDLTWRKLTPLECERLQTVPDNYTNHVSNTQRYKMLGNGWTVEVIKHIYRNMNYESNKT